MTRLDDPAERLRQVLWTLALLVLVGVLIAAAVVMAGPVH